MIFLADAMLILAGQSPTLLRYNLGWTACACMSMSSLPSNDTQALTPGLVTCLNGTGRVPMAARMDAGHITDTIWLSTWR